MFGADLGLNSQQNKCTVPNEQIKVYSFTLVQIVAFADDIFIVAYDELFDKFDNIVRKVEILDNNINFSFSQILTITIVSKVLFI